ncbi:DUF6415 family natural product biosynthesis protein [Streptomyces sp. NPDC102451]|uniref:DUF6415 family natural product biosynthesis protein n=1 Tax=Streptomyces sp. NPDC102451 TaxID=3366177 RepID=UPI00380FAE13
MIAHAHAVPRDPMELRRVLQKMRAWEPFDADALLDDVGAALDDVPDMPGDPRRAVGHLRRMAWTVNELLKRLLVTGQLTNVDVA